MFRCLVDFVVMALHIFHGFKATSADFALRRMGMRPLVSTKEVNLVLKAMSFAYLYAWLCVKLRVQSLCSHFIKFEIGEVAT